MLWLALVPPCPRDRPAYPPETWTRLACWAGRFTPRVVLSPDALGLEIAGSLRLFGGLPRLLERVRADLAALEMPMQLALATTPRAALWLAGSGDGQVCTDAVATRAALRAVPLGALPLAPEQRLRLTGFGLRHLGDAMALPRAALALRLGSAFVLDLARALGEVEEPQSWFVFPERHAQMLELPAPVEAAPVLMFAARRLLGPLVGWLEARQASLREVVLNIDHGHGRLTSLPLRFSVPVHAQPRIERVLKEALERLVLAAPALAIGLTVDHAEPREGRSQVLFEGATGEGGKLAELLDRLTARLGDEAVSRLACHADHRPERATRRWGPDSKVGAGRTAPLPGLARPLWLLATPRALTEQAGRPCHQGPLQLLAGPERIEAGWWDGDEIRRDYFIALDGAKRWYWIFRQQENPAGWYLHGWFS